MGNKLILPENYVSKLNLRETEQAIKLAKDLFERNLATALNLKRVSAPLYVKTQTGLNDDLNGTERPVSFDILDIKAEVQIVHSLAKWKRMALKKYGFKPGEGLYTDMNAIRRDESLDNLHSVYVDQWDWETIISREERNIEKLKSFVKLIVSAIKETADTLSEQFPSLKQNLTKDIHFVSSQELENEYPDKTPFERESECSKKHGLIFVSQIGKTLKSGKRHDGRAPDYDDWELNGDIIYWSPILNRAVEISSMGIRVDEKSLDSQLKSANCDYRREYTFHKMLLNGELPLTIGGGIGQSRLCMLLLQKAHIGEVQVSVWPDKMTQICAEHGIVLL